MRRTRTRRRMAMEIKRKKISVIGTIGKVVVEAETNAEITIVVAVVVIIPRTISTEGMDQVQMMIVLSMVDISGANATRILEVIIIILREEEAEMEDKAVAMPGKVTMVEEVVEVAATIITTTTEIITAMSITIWMVHSNKSIITIRIMAKEPINRMLNNTTLIWLVILHLQVRE
jgi:hypothetical protein